VFEASGVRRVLRRKTVGLALACRAIAQRQNNVAARNA
jgi:hypothetical protein